MKTEVQSLDTVYSGAPNEEPNILMHMYTRNKHVFEFMDQCNPSFKSPN